MMNSKYLVLISVCCSFLLNAQELYKGIKHIEAKTYKIDKNKKEYISENLDSYFDKEGKRTGWKNVVYDNLGSIKNIVKIQYKDGKVITETNYKPDSTIIKKIITNYDDKGKALSEIEYNMNNEIVGKTIYKKYDIEGNPLEYFTYDSKGKKSSVYKILYENNKKLFKNLRSMDNKINWVTKYLYDNNGKLKETKTVDVDSKMLMFWDKYNEKGLIFEENVYAGKYIIISKNYQYVYDNKEHWTERAEYKDASKTSIEEIVKRTLDYY